MDGLQGIMDNWSIYVCVCVCVCVCMYVYIQTHTYIYIYIYIHTHTHMHEGSRKNIIQIGEYIILMRNIQWKDT